MQVTVNVPETLPEDMLQKLIRQFEGRLERIASDLSLSSNIQPLSKWAKVARKAHAESPLKGLSGYVLECSQDIRNNFAFQHDIGEE